jgi:hypothetical protein
MSSNELAYEKYAEEVRSTPNEVYVLFSSWSTDAFQTPKTEGYVNAVYRNKPTVTQLARDIGCEGGCGCLLKWQPYIYDNCVFELQSKELK